jgi:biofilm protein TabA
MIFDQLDHLQQYGLLPKNIAEAIAYLRKTDFTKAAAGRHEIDGDRLYAMVQYYHPKPVADIIWEAHRRYIDVQYIAKGAEQMGHMLLKDSLTISQPYDADRDVIFYKGQGSLFRLEQGEAAIFWPHDIHAPGLAIDENSNDVCKVVVKCRVD